MRRVSIRSMMCYVAFFAIGAAALRNADGFWAGLITLVTAGTLGIAVLASIERRGRERSWWRGFALFGCVYTILVFSSWSGELGQRFLTSWVFFDLQRHALPNAYSGMDSSRLNSEYTQTLSDYELHKKNGTLDEPSGAAIVRQLNVLRETLTERGHPAAATFELTPEQLAMRRLRVAMPGMKNAASFTAIGHCLIALVAGLFGGFVGSRMYDARTAGPTEIS